MLATLSVRDTAAAMRSWHLHAEATTDSSEPASRPSELYLSETLDGRRELSGHVSAEDGAVVEAALAAAGRDFDPAELPPVSYTHLHEDDGSRPSPLTDRARLTRSTSWPVTMPFLWCVKSTGDNRMAAHDQSALAEAHQYAKELRSL